MTAARRRASCPSASARCRRRASAGSSTSSRRWPTSSASAWASPTSTRRGRSSRRASRVAPRGPDALHRNYGTLELRRALSAPPRAPVRRRATTRRPRSWSPSARRRRSTSRCAATCDPGDEVILHEPSYVAYVPAIVFAGGIVRHVATRFEDDFALDPAAVEAAITPRTKALFLGYPCNPTGAVLAGRRPGRAGRHRRPPRPARLQRRDLRPARLRRLPPPPISALPRDARPDDPDRRLLEGVRDDRLAGRLRGRAGGDPRRHGQGPPVRDHVGADDRPGRRRSSRSSRASRTSSGWSPSTTAGGGCSSTGSTRIGLETFEPRGAFYAFPRDRARPGLTTRSSASGC